MAEKIVEAVELELNDRRLGWGMIEAGTLVELRDSLTERIQAIMAED